jgi:SAM-dependent methyltransferase
MSPLDWAHARDAYDGLAAVYDRLTEDYDHELWLSRLLGACGSSGGRVLDVGCGTGKSFVPLIGHGFDIAACDISPEMIRIARRRLGVAGSRRVFVADMRRLPPCGPFSLVSCLDDAVNYVLGPSELLEVFRGVRRLLAPDGVFVFDTNTLHTYRTAFAGTHPIVCGEERFVWRGRGSSRLHAGGTTAAVVSRAPTTSVPDALTQPVEDVGVHRQRHHGIAEVVELLTCAGLVADVVLGQSTGCVLDRHADDLARTKTVYVARHASTNGRGGEAA